jgi:hypothetical protein
MGGLFLSFSHRSSILLVGLLALSTHLLWAQKTSPVERTHVQLPDAPSLLATVSEAQAHFRLSYGILPLSFEPNRKSWTRFFPPHRDYDLLPINTNVVPVELWGKEKHFISSAPTKWVTFAPAFGQVGHEPIHGNDLEYFGHHIPLAGSIIVRICQQAKAHPHVTRVVTSFRPQF